MLSEQQNAAFFSEAFQIARAMAILRGFDLQRTRELALTAWKAGIRLVEVPLQNETAASAIRSIADENRGVLGAGTITTSALASEAADVGAEFTVSPGYDPAVAQRSLELGMPHLPGVATPTEVAHALADGFTWLKAFPASVLTPHWIRAMHGPFPNARFVVTGGITIENFDSFLEAGASAVSFGTAVEDVNAGVLERL